MAKWDKIVFQQLLTHDLHTPVHIPACKQLPSNQSFDKQISSHRKGGGVSRWGNGLEWQLLSSLLHAP